MLRAACGLITPASCNSRSGHLGKRRDETGVCLITMNQHFISWLVRGDTSSRRIRMLRRRFLAAWHPSEPSRVAAGTWPLASPSPVSLWQRAAPRPPRLRVCFPRFGPRQGGVGGAGAPSRVPSASCRVGNTSARRCAVHLCSAAPPAPPPGVAAPSRSLLLFPVTRGPSPT